LIEMQDMKVFEFWVKRLETPEQHSNSLRHVAGSTKVSLPPVEPTSFVLTQFPSLR
jgi:hypothetical protein